MRASGWWSVSFHEGPCLEVYGGWSVVSGFGVCADLKQM